MITIDSDPKLNPINIGAFILVEMSQSEYSEFEIEYLYNLTKQKYNASYDIFVFSLDWLYIAGAIALNEKGMITNAVN